MLQQKNLFWAKKEKLEEEDGTKSQFTDATIDESV